MTFTVTCGKGFRVPAVDIIVDERARTDYRIVPELMESIQRYGLFNPVLVQKLSNGKFKLIAGECRYKAMLLLGAMEIPCTYREDLSNIELKEIELEENLRRSNLSWPEENKLILEIDDLKRQEHGSAMQGGGGGSWSQSKTAALIGRNRESVTKKIKLAKLMLDNPVLAERVKTMPESAAVKVIEREIEARKLKQLAEKGILKTSNELRLGDAQSLFEHLADESVDLLITDPPFGIPVITDNEGKDRGKVQTYTSQLSDTDNADVAMVTNMFNLWLAKELYRVLKPGAHFYIFFCYECYTEIFNALKKSGLSIDPVPLTWFKGRATAVFRGYNYMACSEPIFFGHKPPRSRRLNKPEKSLLMHSPVELSKRLHPFEKPQSLIKLFIELSSERGELVLDPFMGSGAVPQAALDSGRSIIGFEINETYYHIAQNRINDM